MAGRLRVQRPRRQGRRRAGPVPRLDQWRAHRGHRPADDRLDLRLHDLAVGTPQAVHLHRVDPRPRLPRRHRVQQHADRDRRVHRAPAVQLELCPGPVPGVHPGPRPGAAGRDRQRARRAHADPRRRVRVCHRCDRGRHASVRDRSRHARRARARDDVVGRDPGPRGSGAQVPWRASVAFDRRGGVGHRRPAGRRASCGWSGLGSRS